MMCENAKIVKEGTHGTRLNSMQENDFLDVGDASFFSRTTRFFSSSSPSLCVDEVLGAASLAKSTLQIPMGNCKNTKVE